MLKKSVEAVEAHLPESKDSTSSSCIYTMATANFYHGPVLYLEISLPVKFSLYV